MNSERSAPTSLKIVAVILILGGIFSAIKAVVSLWHGHINVDLVILGLWAGPGLLRFNRGWRTYALISAWIALVVAPIFALLVIFHLGPLESKFFESTLGFASKEVVLGLTAIAFLLVLWIYRVLTRPDIRKLFGIGDSEHGHQA